MVHIIKNYVDDVIINQKKIPYFDILVKKGHDTVYRYFNNLDGNATGKEKLYMYSCSKVITAVATMMLIERGVIRLEDEVSKYLPSFNNTFLIKNGEKVKNKNPVTIKHLLTMSSGLDYNFNSKFIKQRFIDQPTSTVSDISEEIVKMPLNFEPGEMFKYGLSHDVLGAVIEQISNMRFSDFIEREIFTPLSMKNSSFKFDDKGFEPLYYCHNGDILPFNFEQEKWANHPTYDGGGGGLKSTVEDYSKFLEVLANGGKTQSGFSLIKPETLNLMTIETTKQLSVENTYTCVQGKDYGYGLGVRVRTIDTPWGLTKKEFGWDGAAGSYAMVDPNKNVSITIGMHIRNWPEVFSGEHLKIVEMVYKTLI